MTKFKLRNMVIAGVMAMGLAMTSGMQVNAKEVDIGDIKGINISIDLKDEKIILSKSGQNTNPIFYTDVKNAKKTVPTSDKWIKASEDRLGGDTTKAVIDFSYTAKEKVLYIAATPTPKAEDIIAVTIPAQPALTARYTNPIGKINSDKPNTGKGNDKDVFDFTTKVGKTAQPVSINRIQIKKTTASQWSDFSTFFSKGVLENLQNKGTTLYSRITPLENVTLDFVDVENGDKINETKRYSIVASQEDKTDTINNIVRGSASAKIAIKGRANASKVTYDYDKFTIKIGKGFSYQKLNDLTEIVTEEEFKANTILNPKGEIINIPQATSENSKEQYYAIRKEGTDRAIASNINYVTVPTQPLIENVLEDDNIIIEIIGMGGEEAKLTFKTKDGSKLDKDAKAINYQYAIADPIKVENKDESGNLLGTLDLTSKDLKWKKASITKNKSEFSVIIPYGTKENQLNTNSVIYIRKVSDKKTNTLASTFYKLEQPEIREYVWKASYQTNKTKINLIEFGTLDISVNEDDAKKINLSIPIEGLENAGILSKDKISINKIVGKDKKSVNFNLTLDNDKKILNISLELEGSNNTKLEVFADTGAIDEIRKNGKTISSSAKKYTFTVDNENPKVATNTINKIKVGNGKENVKVDIKFTEEVFSGDIDLTKTTIKTASGDILELSDGNIDKSGKKLTLIISSKVLPDHKSLTVVLPDGITDLNGNKLVGDIVSSDKGFKIEVVK